MALRAFLVFFLMCVGFVQAEEVLQVRLGVSSLDGEFAQKTRVVLDVKTPVNPRVFTLPGPHRVVLDFPELDFEESLSAVKLDERGVVHAMRQGVFEPGTTRMVLDVEDVVDVHVFHIPPTVLAGQVRPHRIVIDLTRQKSGKSAVNVRQFSGKVAAAPIVAAKPTPISQQTLAPVVRKAKPEEKDGPFIVVIDPGHGGVDPGAIGKRKTYEKHVALETANRIRRELEKQPDTKVYMTRTSDKFVKLDERVRFAQRRDADIFISVHADAHHVRTVRGGSVYVVSEKASDAEAARLAENANKGDLFGGLDIRNEPREVQNILIDLTRRETKNRSVRLGKEVLQEMDKVAHLRKDEVLFAGFRVLKAPEIPSILVELAYLSNPNEEKLLNTRNHQTKLARAIAAGVQDYRRKYVTAR